MNNNRITLHKTIAHFRTITHHRHVVCRECFQVGLYWQGLTHDLSKYSPTEFWVGARYYQGTRSPNNAEREDKGLSTSWLHHRAETGIIMNTGWIIPQRDMTASQEAESLPAVCRFAM